MKEPYEPTDFSWPEVEVLLVDEDYVPANRVGDLPVAEGREFVECDIPRVAIPSLSFGDEFVDSVDDVRYAETIFHNGLLSLCVNSIIFTIKSQIKTWGKNTLK